MQVLLLINQIIVLLSLPNKNIGAVFLQRKYVLFVKLELLLSNVNVLTGVIICILVLFSIKAVVETRDSNLDNQFQMQVFSNS